MEMYMETDPVILNTVLNPWKRVRTNDTEELFQNVMGILNKITFEKFNLHKNNFERLPINTEERIIGVVDIIINKAVEEPIYSALYAKLCHDCSGFEVEKRVNGKYENVNFVNVLISKCQSSFFSRNFDCYTNDLEEMAEYINTEQKNVPSDKERMFRKGMARFMGELFKLDMLTAEVILRCVTYLLDDCQEMSLECLHVLLTTVGKKALECDSVELYPYAPAGGLVCEGRGLVRVPREEELSAFEINQLKELYAERLSQAFRTLKEWDEHFEKICELALKKEGSILSTRIRFMMEDLVELRRNRWIPKRQPEIPRTIREING